MDYEKAYKEALKTVQEILSSGSDSIMMSRLKLRLQSVFPELKESDDEITRKSLILYLENKRKVQEEAKYYQGVEGFERWIAWLEKQGKPKWTKEDEIGSDETIELLEYFINYAPEFRKPSIKRSIDWLNSLKQRMEEQV